MITLASAHIWKYKSIEDSNDVPIDQDVTVIVGKNESGKTAFLEAMNKSLAHGEGDFDVVSDYPRKDLFKYRPKHEAKQYQDVAKLKFMVGDQDVKKMNDEVFGGAEVLPKGFTFTRTTTYANTNAVGIWIDGKKSLKALRATLGDIEHADTVFKDATELKQVIANIETLSVPTDSTLGKFAKEWADRFKPALTLKGWDMIDHYIWSKYLQPGLPNFLYFDDYRLLPGKVNLDSLSQKKDTGTLTEGDETLLGLLDIAGITLKELMSDEGYETAKAKLEAIGLNITQQVFDFWKQNQELSVEFDIKADPTDQPPYNTGKNLYIRIKNLRHGVTVPFDQRSKGFIWFFSFLAWFSAIQNRVETSRPLILLLDEPGLNLHALAQRDFLAYIDELSATHQIIYSTHSPFMVDSNRLDRVRVVEDRVKEGTKLSSDLQNSNDDSIFPLQAALGYTIAQNLFISRKNVLVEGPADLLLLQHMSTALEQAGKTALSDGVLVPVGGLDKIATFVALIGAQDLDLVVLHDRGASPNQRLDDMVKQKIIERTRVLDYSLFRETKDLETDLEDLFPEEIYIQAFNAAYAKELGEKQLNLGELGKAPRIIDRINRWLEKSKIQLLADGGFNHYRVALALIPLLTKKNVTKECLTSFEVLFEKVNGLLADKKTSKAA